MASIFGRSIIVPLTNKSGGSVVLGDVVVVDTTTDESFTTTTSAASTSAIGVAAETIANNAVGRVIVGGYASLVNVNASVTRNQFGTTHTVAKQAVASATRVAGTFCRWLKTSATPSAYIYPVDLAGTALTDPTTTRGDIITRGAAALGRLAMATTGKVLGTDGTDAVYVYPPGFEFQYDAVSGDVTISGTTEGGATTIKDATAFTADGALVVTSLYCPQVFADTTATTLNIVLLDGATVVAGRFATLRTPTVSGSDYRLPLYAEIRWTPSAGAHTLHVLAFKSSGTWQLSGAGGGSGALAPMFLRTVKV